MVGESQHCPKVEWMEAQDESFDQPRAWKYIYGPNSFGTKQKKWNLMTHKHILCQHSLRGTSNCWKLLDSLI